MARSSHAGMSYARWSHSAWYAYWVDCPRAPDESAEHCRLALCHYNARWTNFRELSPHDALDLVLREDWTEVLDVNPPAAEKREAMEIILEWFRDLLRRGPALGDEVSIYDVFKQFVAQKGEDALKDMPQLPFAQRNDPEA